MEVSDNLKNAIAEWIYRGKIAVYDLPEDVRRKYYDTFYVYAFRRSRELYQVNEYVKVMRLMWADWAYAKERTPSEANNMMMRLFDAYWGVELLFKGEEEFKELAQALVKQYPKIFG